MKIAIAADHAGFDYKVVLKAYLNQKYIVNDFGTESTESCDYPDYTHPLAASVSVDENDFGILICGSGNGVCMTANKHKNIRAALCWNTELAMLSRLHNDANIVCIPARFIDIETAKNIVETFLNTSFEGGRHERRVEKIDI